MVPPEKAIGPGGIEGAGLVHLCHWSCGQVEGWKRGGGASEGSQLVWREPTEQSKRAGRRTRSPQPAARSPEPGGSRCELARAAAGRGVHGALAPGCAPASRTWMQRGLLCSWCARREPFNSWPHGQQSQGATGSVGSGYCCSWKGAAAAVVAVVVADPLSQRSPEWRRNGS